MATGDFHLWRENQNDMNEMMMMIGVREIVGCFVLYHFQLFGDHPMEDKGIFHVKLSLLCVCVFCIHVFVYVWCWVLVGGDGALYK